MKERILSSLNNAKINAAGLAISNVAIYILTFKHTDLNWISVALSLNLILLINNLIQIKKEIKNYE